MKKTFNSYYEDSFKQFWNKPALSDYEGETYKYSDIALRIEKLHIIFEECGIKQGDKISIIGRNSSNWGIVFLAAITYGAVAVPILNEFKPNDVHNIINHSESRVLFVGDFVWKGLNREEMPNLNVIIQINDFKILYAKRSDINIDATDEIFARKYPNGFKPENIKYYAAADDELAIINYTSGTTGFSKGVMLPYRSMLANLEFARNTLPGLLGHNVVSMLPMAHMYGLQFEFLFEISVGCHVFFLSRTPTPKIILDAFARIKPKLIISVPLVIEKIYKKKILPQIEKPLIKFLLKTPIVNIFVRKKIRKQLMEAFGGNFYEIVVGGASMNRETEEFFRTIKFPYTVGYGMTECGPLISYIDWSKTRIASCGRAIPSVQIKIDNPNPETGVGEIFIKGANVLLGYFKNDEATKAAIDTDGWLHTGDLGTIDKDGYIFIKGRSKNMILGPSGQNIYPEEIEDRVNNMPYINESIVVEDNGKLVALVYPDNETAEKDGITPDKFEEIMDKNRVELNKILPTFSQIAQIRIHPEEFEKTPKKSIKRFLYQKEI